MEDEGKLKSPDISVNHTRKRRISLISIILIAIIGIALVATIIVFFINNSNDLRLKGKKFILSDNSILYFIDENTYSLSYKIMSQEVVMNGKYKISYEDNINENVIYEYESYIDRLDREKYVLGFLELLNEEIFVNGEKIEKGYVNTYYIMTILKENDCLVFNGYNVDTGIKVKFEENS